MSIPIEAHAHPAVAEALARANAVICRWIDSEASGGDARVAECIVGWPGVSLAEEIAWALLEAEGFDIEGLRDAIEAAPRQAVGDVLGAWPRRICSPPGGIDTSRPLAEQDCTCGRPFDEHVGGAP